MKSKSLLIVFCLIIVMVTFPLLESAQAAPKAEVTRRQTASPYNILILADGNFFYSAFYEFSDLLFIEFFIFFLFFKL
jgi:biopolymer transport protein ExbD